ncbi:MAG: hypothetical protein ACOX8A_11830 [Thermacetogeniaceae bacterium]|jgi:hypothetical protein
MIRKIVSIFIIAILLCLSSIPVCANELGNIATTTQENNFGVSPLFVGVDRIVGIISISPSGIAQVSVSAFPKTSTSLDYILTTASIVNGNGTAVKTWTNVKSTKNAAGYFLFNQSYALQSRGKYKLVYTVKCYKDGVMIDTASSETGYDTY